MVFYLQVITMEILCPHCEKMFRLTPPQVNFIQESGQKGIRTYPLCSVG